MTETPKAAAEQDRTSRAGDGARLRFGPVDRRPTLTELVTDRLKESIQEAGLVGGARLPSERELSTQFGVSRTVIREAVRSLVGRGVLEVRTGSGVSVVDPNATDLSYRISQFLQSRGGLEPAAIHEVRELLELRTTRLAAERATDEDLAAILASVDDLDAAQSGERSSRADVEFHRAIATAAHNPLFLVLIDSIGDVLLAVRQATLDNPDRRKKAAAEHRVVADALLRRDPDAAEAAMGTHLAVSLIVLRDAMP